jgi:epoxyqueuosine reductase
MEYSSIAGFDMSESDLIAMTRQELLNEGILSRLVPISRLEEVKAEIMGVLSSMTDQGLIKYINACFDLQLEKAISDPKSVLIMGLSSPKVCFRFANGGRTIDAIVPPTYLDYTSTKAKIESILGKTLGANNRKYGFLQIPAKLLAVRSGLAEYGRNNITYVGDFGSHVRLSVYATDVPVGEHEWHEKRMMDSCESCEVCLRNCPTGAIDKSRFLLRAERCLTLINEEETEIPGWVDSSWHNCLVGCLRCQDVCPVNHKVSKQYAEGISFSDDETEILKRTTRLEDLQGELREKVESSGLSNVYPVLPRNIVLLLNRRS